MTDVDYEIEQFYSDAAREARTVTTVTRTAEAPAFFGSGVYEKRELEDLPSTVLASSLGCGNPLHVVALHEGEVVLDLGSGGGLDALLSARRVGPGGKVYGVERNEAMLALALEHRDAVGATNVEFLRGSIESVPLASGTVDVVISNCAVNLAGDKSAVFTEIRRVLRDGGRVGIHDVVASNELTAEDRAARGSFASCIAGALTFAEYEDGLRAAGFVDVEAEATNEIGDGMYAAVVRARKPAAAENGPAPSSSAVAETPFAGGTREFFERLPSLVDPAQIAGMTGSFRFDVEGEGAWTVSVADGRVEVEEAAAEAECVLTVPPDLLEDIVAGRESAMGAFMSGRLLVAGDMCAALKLQQLL